MQPVGQIPGAELDRVRGIFMDIDDTLTTDGQLGAQAYCALERLHRAGLVSIPITGRPAGWCDHIARMWPVDAVVGENGAFYFCHDREQRRMHKRFLHDDAVREQHRGRLERLAIAILSEVPGSGVASDQPYRESDLAIDYCEDVPPLPAQQIDKIVDMFERAGATAKVSSIHVNGWFGTYDKLGMTKLLMQERFGVDLDRDKGRYIFVGDSPNDAPMFEYFPASVGVANVSDFCERLAVAPAYVTDARSGAGFSELAELVLARGRGHGSGSGLP